MPLSRQELHDLSAVDVREPLAPESLMQALTTPPFVPTKTIVNLRDLGATPGNGVKEGLVYRSGTLEVAKGDPASLAWLSSNVKRIFDIRSPRERDAAADPVVDGVENTWFNSLGPDTKPDLEAFAVGDGREGLAKEYMKVLSIYQPTFTAVLEHVRDRPGEPFLFHCSGGSQPYRSGLSQPIRPEFGLRSYSVRS
jgi:hypothetical protein